MFEDTSIRRYNMVKMTIEVEKAALHRECTSAIEFELDSHLLFTCGHDTFLKVWDYSFQREPHQISIGHTGNINGLAFVNNKLWSVGSEGLLVWNFSD